MKLSATCCMAGRTVVEPLIVTVPAYAEPITIMPARALIVINLAFVILIVSDQFVSLAATPVPSTV